MIMASDKPEFREEIAGLRAIAVLLVIFFHFGVPYFGGGFVGVDVFFVISGFLMTKIIAGGLQRGAFSYWRFMGARWRRIVPALAAMTMTVMVVAYLIIEPLTFLSIAKSGVSSLAFVSNFYYLFQSGYFAPASEQNWFLHTWSLSVEWQFYIFYPFFLMALNMFGGGRYLRAVLVAATLVSVALCIWMSAFRPVYAFYLLPFRAWELTCGGLVFAWAAALKQGVARTLEIVGILLILLSATLFDRGMQWPSYWAMVPVIGSMLIIACARGDVSILNTPSMQLIGKLSYSIYLVHWPLVTGLRYFSLQGVAVMAIGVVASLALGALSYGLMERPRQQALKLRAVGMPLIATAMLLAVIAFGGLPGRSTNAALLVDTINARTEWGFPNKDCEGFLPDGSVKTCSLGPKSAASILVIGDSKAQEWYPRYAASNRNLQEHVVFATRAGCAPITRVERADPGHNCARFVNAAYRLAKTGGFKRVVIIAAWSEYFGPAGNVKICVIDGNGCVGRTDATSRLGVLSVRLKDDLAQLAAAVSEVVVVEPLPTPDFDLPQELAKRLFAKEPISDLKTIPVDENSPLRRRLDDVIRAAGVRPLDPVDYMCERNQCPVLDANNQSLYKDAVHLRPSVVRDVYAFMDTAVIRQ